MTETPHILLVEDDPSLRFLIADRLEQEGYSVTQASDGMEAFDLFKGTLFDLCIVDVMLPKMDGFTLVERIRIINNSIPILFLTARSMREDKIKGFQTGADDYVIKPFSMEELLLRIHVFLNRRIKTASSTQTKHFVLNSYVFDYANLQLTHERENRKLTQKQADLLKLLCQNCERMIKREEMLNSIWGNDDYFSGRSMDVFISKLRRYLSHDPAIRITNYHGVGFKLSLTGND